LACATTIFRLIEITGHRARDTNAQLKHGCADRQIRYLLFVHSQQQFSVLFSDANSGRMDNP